MADYWLYDRLTPGSFPGKRPRSELDVAPLGAVPYYTREELPFEERRWRELEPYGSTGEIGRSGLSYGSSATDLTSNPILGGIDPGLGKSSSLALNGGISRQESLIGAPHVLLPGASSTLFVEGLPSNCTKREAAHIFRPFVGFKEVRIVHKEAKRAGADQFVLCFVDFVDPRAAAVALEALQGYKFDESDPGSESLRLQFARNPGVQAGGRDDFRGGRDEPRNRSFRR